MSHRRVACPRKSTNCDMPSIIGIYNVRDLRVSC